MNGFMVVILVLATIVALRWKLRSRQNRYRLERAKPASRSSSPKTSSSQKSRSNAVDNLEVIATNSASQIASSSPIRHRAEPIPPPTRPISKPVPAAAVLKERSDRPSSRERETVRAVLNGLTWIGRDAAITIENLRIEDPLAYFTDSRRVHDSREPAAVDVALDIAKGFDDPGRLSYWPRYADLNPYQRRYYLRWLSEGKKFPPAELGYAFLYFYGLERRALVDATDDLLIYDEVMRLRRMFRDSGQTISRSWESYSLSFLWFLHLARPDRFQLEHVEKLAAQTTSPKNDHVSGLQVWFAATKTPLTPWAAYFIAQTLPDSARSVVQRRVGNQFRELFFRKYSQQFGAGLELRCAKNDRQYVYHAASAIFRGVAVDQINPGGITSQYKPLSRIWNDCIDELKKLSTVVAKEGPSEMTVAAWDATPDELRVGIDHPLTEKFCDLVGQAEVVEGCAVVSAEQLSKALGIGNGIRLTPGQSRIICRVADHIGYAIEPDARIIAKGYEPSQSLAVVLKTTDEPIDRSRFLAASCMLHVGMFAASADENFRREQFSFIAKKIESAFTLNEAEHKRLDALRVLVLKNGPDLNVISKLAKALDAEKRGAIGRFALALVAADGVITPSERRALRTCYTKLGFKRDEIDRVMGSMQLQAADDPVTVAEAKASIAGEAIEQPTQHKEISELQLNRAAIAAIMEDTRDVAALLASAMGTNTDAEVAEAAAHDEVSESAAPRVSAATSMSQTPENDLALPQRYASLYQMLIAKTQWSIKDADAVARANGHMLSGAIETLNEWAVDKYGSQLFIEESDIILVETTILN